MTTALLFELFGVRIMPEFDSAELTLCGCQEFYNAIIKWRLHCCLNSLVSGSRQSLILQSWHCAVARNFTMQLLNDNCTVVWTLWCQDHLVCFLAGTLALGAHNGLDKDHMTLGEELAHTCYQTYVRQATRLAPEITYFNLAPDAAEDLIVKVGPTGMRFQSAVVRPPSLP